jgi:hypothetical protein
VNRVQYVPINNETYSVCTCRVLHYDGAFKGAYTETSPACPVHGAPGARAETTPTHAQAMVSMLDDIKAIAFASHDNDALKIERIQGLFNEGVAPECTCEWAACGVYQGDSFCPVHGLPGA